MENDVIPEEERMEQSRKEFFSTFNWVSRLAFVSLCIFFEMAFLLGIIYIISKC